LLEEKLYPIRGDITLPKFGISPEDLRLLSRDCTIVFNSAATVRFVEPLNISVKNNIYSVGQLIELCNELEHLEAIVHLSTAYSNCHKRDTIYEIFYEPPMRGDQIQASVEKLVEIQNQVHVYPDETDDNTTLERRATSVLEQDDDNRAWSSRSFNRSACKQQKFFHDKVHFPASGGGPNGCTTQKRENGLLASSASSASLLLNNESEPQSPAAGTTDAAAAVVANPQLVATKSDDDATGSYDLLAEFTRIALRMSNRPNTYCLTKAISESYLLDKARSRPDRYLNDKIPVGIVRPSVVCGSWREPLVGMVDNYNGATGAVLALYTGAIQAMPGRGDAVADLVPADLATNMIICAGWFLASTNRTAAAAEPAFEGHKIKPDQGVYLFNFVSGFRNPLKWRQVCSHIAELAYKYPSKFLVRLPSIYFIEAGTLYNIYDALNHKLPAYLSDFVKSKLLGQKCDGRSSAMVSYSRCRQLTQALTPFTSNQWRLCDCNVQALMECLDPVDRDLFHFDVASIDWADYIRSYIIGARIYAMRDEPKNLPMAMSKLRARKHVNSLLTGVMILMAYLLFIRGSQLELALLGALG
jgi:hypothetical protein